MILRAKHHWFIHPFFKFYAIWKTNRHFKPVRIFGELKQSEMSVLLILNHISWWDGFWAMYLNLKVLKRKFHFMMLEDQLRKFWFFNYTGGFSVNKKSRSLLETISYTRDLLQNKENMVLIFPQGEIESMHNQQIEFENGLEHILSGLESKVQLVFMVNLVDYFSNPKPGVNFYFKDYQSNDFSKQSIQLAYNRFYQESLGHQKQLKF